MPSIRQLRRRIRGVQNTRQITRAMELVASSRLRRAQERVTGLAALRGTNPTGHQQSRCSERRAGTPSSASGAAGLPGGFILFTTSRGLCGSLNANRCGRPAALFLTVV